MYTHTHTLYLRSDVVRCPAEGLGGDSVAHIFFTHAEIRNLDVSLAVQHHVVQLQVSAGRKRSVSVSTFIVLLSRFGVQRSVSPPVQATHGTR